MHTIEKMQKVIIVTDCTIIGETMRVTGVIDFYDADGCVLEDDPAKWLYVKNLAVDPEEENDH